MKIIYEDDTDLADFEAESKGYRGDVVVEMGSKKYRLYFTAMKRLLQDFDREFHYYGYYFPEPNTIVVNSVTKEEIELIVDKMSRSDYFERLDRNGFASDRTVLNDNK